MDEGKIRNQRENPRERANFFSVATLWYIVPLIWKGFRKNLDEDDVYKVTRDLNSKKIADKLEKHWEFLKFNNKSPTLLRLIFSCYGRRYFFLGLVQLVMEFTSSILSPLVVAKLVQYFIPGQTSITREEAIVYAFCNFGIMMCMAFYKSHIDLAKNKLALEIRMAFSSLAYRKALRLHPSVFSEMSTGKIVTLITKDLQTIDLAVLFGNDCWVELMIVIFIGYLVFQKVGLAALVILVSIAILFPIQGGLGYLIFKNRKEANKKSDERIQLTQELLSVIRIIKMYTWESFFSDKLIDARKKEVKNIRTTSIYKNATFFMGEIFGRLGYNVVLITYVLLGNTLTPDVVYYVATSYHKIRFILTVLISLSFFTIAEFLASLKRLEIFFSTDEYQPSRQFKQNFMMTTVLVRNASVKIAEAEILKDVTFNLEPGLNLIMGPVGSGKSTLVKSLLREVKISSGNIFINGEISYASQQPWLFPSTIRQNILFGSEFNEQRYKKVIEVCALQPDMKLFPNGDLTRVAESGSNLSKGQQARINLARAVYRESDIYILDDSFSSLDINVQNSIFNNCVKDFLKNKLILLVTHNPAFLEKTENIIILAGGKVAYTGKFDEVAVKNYLNEQQLFDSTDEKIEEELPQQEQIIANGKSEKVEKKKSMKSQNIYSEDMKVGKVGVNAYKRYIQFGGWFLFIFLMLLHVTVEAMMASSEKLISKWVNNQKPDETLSDDEKSQIHQNSIKMILLLSGLTAGAVFAKFVRTIVHVIFSMRVSRNIHASLAKSVMNARVEFFDKNLLGNILNRFSRDLGFIDELLPHVSFDVAMVLFMTVTTTALVMSLNVILCYLAIALFLVMISSALCFLPAARNMVRLEGISRSPMIGHLNSTIEGLMTVRAFKKQEVLKAEFDEHQNFHTSSQYMGIVAWRLLQLFCHILCAMFIGSIMVTFMTLKSEFQAGDVGLSLTIAFGLGMHLQWGIRNVILLESTMTCIERILEYVDEPQEDKNGNKAKNWPNEGSVTFEKLSLTYPTNKKPVLKNISLNISPRNKIGVVGRTGAGKSSIIVALYRFYDIEGLISIDNQNTCDVSLVDLRQGLSIIPQEPVIFSGTIRSNIDPTGKYTDEEIWNSLEAANLKETVLNLDQVIDPKTCGFSLGEKQLISVARAVIRKNKIVILDEATANMDKETERKINMKIKEIFKDCTLLVIAHRMETILDCDKVIVMNRGEVVEYDSPLKLAEDENSMFHDIIRKTGALTTYLDRRK